MSNHALLNQAHADATINIDTATPRQLVNDLMNTRSRRIVLTTQTNDAFDYSERLPKAGRQQRNDIITSSKEYKEDSALASRESNLANKILERIGQGHGQEVMDAIDAATPEQRQEFQHTWPGIISTAYQDAPHLTRHVPDKLMQMFADAQPTVPKPATLKLASPKPH